MTLMRRRLAAIQENPLYRFEVVHWGAIRPNSKRLFALIMLTALLLGMWVRRFSFGIYASDDWVGFPIPPPSPLALGPFLRFWLAEPRLLLGLCVLMIALEDAFRQRASGWLDQVALTSVTGREFLLAKSASLVRWTLPWLALVGLCHIIDAIVLDLLGAFRPPFLGPIDALLSGLRVIELALFIGLSSTLAWGAYLERRRPLEMLGYAAWGVFRCALAAQILYYALIFVSAMIVENLSGGWLRGNDTLGKIIRLLVTELPLTLAMIICWGAMWRRSLTQYGSKFLQLYGNDEKF